MSSSHRGLTILFASEAQNNRSLQLNENALVYHLFISTISGRSKKGDIHKERQLMARIEIWVCFHDTYTGTSILLATCSHAHHLHNQIHRSLLVYSSLWTHQHRKRKSEFDIFTEFCTPDIESQNKSWGFLSKYKFFVKAVEIIMIITFNCSWSNAL